MGLIKVPIDGRVVCAERRHGRGPTLVLLHGAGGNHRSFDELLPLLSGQDLLVPALPGRAESAGPPLESMAEAAQLIRELCEALDIAQVVLVGHSMGGSVAAIVSAAFPERVDRLVSLEAIGPWTGSASTAPQQLRPQMDGDRH